MYNAPIPTPWGQSQNLTPLAKNCHFVSTASHGGLFVPPDISRRTPPAVQKILFPHNDQPGHWMEEDCNAPLAMAFIFPFLDTTMIEATGELAPSQKNRSFWIKAALRTARAFTDPYAPLIPLLEELQTATTTP